MPSATSAPNVAVDAEASVLCGFSPRSVSRPPSNIVKISRCLLAGLRERGVPEQQLAEDRGIAEHLIFGRRYALPKLEDEGDMDFPNAAIAARLISFEEGLLYARSAADRRQADSVIEILSEGRVTFTSEQRADPRYHQLFKHPTLIHIATARRKRGVTGGLPIFPVKPYTGR